MKYDKAIATSIVASAVALGGMPAIADLTIATVNNNHMITMQGLTHHFESETGININWVTLEEAVLRQRVTTDIATKGGQFDIMTIGMYEAPIWGAKGWLEELNFDASYDIDDILPSMRSGLSANGKLYAAPFYGESSMIMYRKDLVEKAGMSITDYASWGHIYDVAKAITEQNPGVYGVCLRGKPSWGDNMAFITTLANSFGARWFDEEWKPQLDSPAWEHAVSFYVDLLGTYGPPGSSSNSFNEILALFNAGKCGMWIDATTGGAFITDPGQSTVADKVAFAQAPIAVTRRGSNWLWAWALAIPAGTQQAGDAKKFVEWATSKEYIELVAENEGWGGVPTGTRNSTYANPEFKKAASFADDELKAIKAADPSNSTLNPNPYTGVQFASIPEFQAIGTATGQQLSAALAGNISVKEALAEAQKAADREMRKAGYY